MVKTSWIFSIEANKEAEKKENRYKGWHKEKMTEKIKRQLDIRRKEERENVLKLILLLY